MTEEFVKREEFENLKKDVEKLEGNLIESEKLLQSIDKKIDVINEKITSSDKIDDLKFNPLESRIKKLEESGTWLWRTIGATIIGIVIKLIFDVSKFIK